MSVNTKQKGEHIRKDRGRQEEAKKVLVITVSPMEASQDTLAAVPPDQCALDSEGDHRRDEQRVVAPRQPAVENER
jgi:hypothetical protein